MHCETGKYRDRHWEIWVDGIAVKLSSLNCCCYIPPATDCGDPGIPTNGQRSLSSTTYNSVVTYTCDVGYTLQGSNSRTCQSSGKWNGSVPQCTGIHTVYIQYICLFCTVFNMEEFYAF